VARKYASAQEVALLKQLEQQAATVAPPYLEGLFTAQRRFVLDQSRRQAAVCTRRAGKTFAVCRKLLRTAASKPGVRCVYIALTRGHAKRTLWPYIHRSREELRLPLDTNETELTATLPNGSAVWLVGADDAREVEKLRGDAYALAVIDEPGSFARRLLGYLIDDVLRAALIDHRGCLCLIGTPAPVPKGAFYEATTGDAYSVHRWSAVENPNIPFQDEINLVLREKGWTESHPTFRREFLGEWVVDLGSLVYPYARERNWTDAAPDPSAKDWRYVLGIDYGFSHATAFAVVGWRRNVPGKTWLIECYQRKSMIPTAAAEETAKLKARWKPERIVGDCSGLGKGYTEEARQRFGIPIEPAEKRNKRGYQELMSGDLTSGAIQIVGASCQDWIDQAEVFPWADEEHDREASQATFQNDCLDAALYAWRETRAHRERELPSQKTLEQLENEKILKLERQMKYGKTSPSWMRY